MYIKVDSPLKPVNIVFKNESRKTLKSREKRERYCELAGSRHFLFVEITCGRGIPSRAVWRLLRKNSLSPIFTGPWQRGGGPSPGCLPRPPPQLSKFRWKVPSQAQVFKLIHSLPSSLFCKRNTGYPRKLTDCVWKVSI